MVFELLAQSRTYGFEGTSAVRFFIGGFSLVVLLALFLIRLPLMGWLLMAVLLITALEPGLNSSKDAFLPTWLLPIQARRAEIHLGLSLLIGVILLATGRFNLARMSVQAWFMFTIMIFSGLIAFFHEGTERGVQTLGFVAATIPAVAIASWCMVDSPDGVLKLVRSILVAAAIWAGACSVQLVLEPSFLLTQGRFQGLLGNPQAAALLIAPILTLLCWVIIHDPIKRNRILWIGLIAIYLLFLLWTGSRTGMAMSVAGAIMVLYRRLGRVVFALPVIALVAIGLSSLADALQIGANLERFTSGLNTRSGVIPAQWAHIQDSPWIGVGWTNLEQTENSYLAAWAAFGIFMFILVLIYLVTSMSLMARLFFRRSEVGEEDSRLIDLVIAFHLLFFLGATSEGFIFGRSTPPQVLMLMFGAMSSYCFARLRDREHQLPMTAHELETEVDPQAVYDYTEHAGVEAPRPDGRFNPAAS